MEYAFRQYQRGCSAGFQSGTVRRLVNAGRVAADHQQAMLNQGSRQLRR